MPTAPPPPCPSWCVSDHDAEDTVGVDIVHRPHIGLPTVLKLESAREVRVIVTREDVMIAPDPQTPGRWGAGTPQVRITIYGSWLVLRSGQDVATLGLLLDDLKDWPRELIERMNDAALIAWPEYMTNETIHEVMRRLRREGAL